MQASSFTSSLKMSSNVYTSGNRIIGANKTSEPRESYKGYWDSNKRKKGDTTDWNLDRTVGEQEGNLSHTRVFTRARLSTHIPKFGGSDTISPRRASNHRYGPGVYSLANRHAVRLNNFVPRRTVSTRSAGSISSSG